MRNPAREKLVRVLPVLQNQAAKETFEAYNVVL
jgi:hypothetical protein